MTAWLVAWCGIAVAAPPAKTGEGHIPGHSVHGEAFDAGPRSPGPLRPGMGRVWFPVTTAVAAAQDYITQGVGQLHGFWYFEAERSFRQAAALDANCAMAYWGMAMANVNNLKRARGFIAEAVKRQDRVSRREQLWIDATAKYVANTGTPASRAKDYYKALEGVIHEFPDDLEAQAFLAWAMWANDFSLPIASRQAVDSLISEVLRANPDHPGAHHYRIHLWDAAKPQRALLSADQFGPSQPGIAHAWHMPGHIYDKLKRYDAAATAQEMSARVDHRHMAEMAVMPYEIHNYAHNNQWLVTSLTRVGRSADAQAVATSLCEVPRHPRHNRPQSSGSCARFGRTRLIETLVSHERWSALLAACDSGLIQDAPSGDDHIAWLRWSGLAAAETGDTDRARDCLAKLEALVGSSAADAPKPGSPANPPVTADQPATGDQPAGQAGTPPAQADTPPAQAGTPVDNPRKSPLSRPPAAPNAGRDSPDASGTGRGGGDTRRTTSTTKTAATCKTAIAEITARLAARAGDHKTALTHLRTLREVSRFTVAACELAAGEVASAIATARSAAEGAVGQLPAWAAYAEILCRVPPDKAPPDHDRTTREALAKVAALAIWADADLPVMVRLRPLAAARGVTLPAGQPDNAVASPPASPATTCTPSRDSYGPLVWQPSLANPWQARDAAGRMVGSATFAGRPVVVLLHLGPACSHCTAQLAKFAPLAAKFTDLGIALVAISSTDLTTEPGAALPFASLADPDGAAFRALGAFDGFESAPLHGTFLIDAEGRIRFKDVGPDPFDDAAFLLDEARRLLGL